MHIFTDQIEFQVDEAFRGDGLDICMFEGIRDDSNVEFGSFDVEDGEADAIEANGSFFDDEVAEFLREFEAVFPTAIHVFPFEAGGGGIDMALDDVAVEATVHHHTSFEVDEVAWLPAAKV